MFQRKMAITLNNGFKMPMVGLGVFRVEDKDMRELVINAIKIGYRHFDCAGTLSVFSLNRKSLFLTFYVGGRGLVQVI